MQRTGQTLPCQAPSRPSYIPGHSSLNRRCNTSRLRKNGKALRRSGWSLNSFGGIRHIVVSVAPFIRQAQLDDVYRWAVSDPE